MVVQPCILARLQLSSRKPITWAFPTSLQSAFSKTAVSSIDAFAKNDSTRAQRGNTSMARSAASSWALVVAGFSVQSRGGNADLPARADSVRLAESTSSLRIEFSALAITALRDHALIQVEKKGLASSWKSKLSMAISMLDSLWPVRRKASQ